MNSKLVLFGLPIILLMALFAGINSLAQAHASGFPSGPGTVCLLDSSAVSSLSAPGPCQSFGPYTFDGPYPSAPQTGPTEIRVGVYVNGSAGLNAFDIILASNSSILQPIGFDLTGSVLTSPQVIVQCQGIVLVQGSSCAAADTSNTFELSVVAAPGTPLTVAPTTGLLFTAIYNIVGIAPTGGVSLGFQTGCTGTSVASGACVTVANGTATPVSETVQTGTLFDNSACASTCTIPWVAVTTNSTTITVPMGAASSNVVAIIPLPENGSPGLSSDSISFAAVASTGFSNPTFPAGNSCSPGGTTTPSCPVMLAVNTSTPGTYSITVLGTYVAFDISSATQPTNTLVGTTVIHVNIQAVAWSIDSISSSTPQTLYIGTTSPMNLLFTAQSLGGYTGTITYQTNTLSDGGTGISFTYPASFVLGSGQTITQTIAASATADGTALYQAALVTSAPTLVNQSSAVLTIHVTGFSLTAASLSLTFAAFSSASDSITAHSLPASAAGFAGKVTLSKTVTGGPLTVTCPASVTLTAGGSASGNCTFSGTVAGNYTVVVKGTGGTNGAITNTTTILVTVTSTPKSIAIAPNPASLTSPVNTNPFSTVKFTGKGGLTGTIVVSETASPSTGITCTLSNIGIPTPAGNTTLSCTSAIAQIYTVTITGTDGSVTDSLALTFTFTDFSVSASPTTITMIAGVPAASAITVAPINGFTGTVTLTDVVAPPGLSCGLSATIIVLGPATTSTLTCSGAAGTYTVAVTGTSGAIAHTTTVTYIVVPATPALSTLIINVAGAPVTTVTAGSMVYDQAMLSGGFPATGVTGSVSYVFYANGVCSAPGTPEGTVTVGPGNSVGPSNLVTVGPAGSYSFQATYGGDANNSPVASPCEQLTATDFVMTSSPSMVNTSPGVAGSSTISLIPVNRFTDNVALTVSISPGAGLTCTLAPTTVTGGSGNSTLSCSGVGGTYAVTVTGTDSNLSHTTTVTVNVADFTLSASPSAITVPLGPPAGTTMITVSPLGGFAGSVSFTASAPAGFSTIFAPSSITLAGTSLLTIGVSPPAVPGTYLVNVTGTSGTLTHTVTITVTVTAASAVLPPVFTQATWDHRFSLSKYNDVQTWRFGVQNNSTSTTIYFSVTISGTDTSGTLGFTQSTAVFTEPAGKNLSQLSLSQPFSPSELGDTFSFTMVIHWGTTATNNSASLPFTSTLSLSGIPTSGSFTVLA